MGTYTANKELFMPTVGEQGWGTLVNGNFETIDNFLKPISLSGSTYTFTGNQKGGSVSATSITNSGTSTFTGKITANGGIGTKALTATTGTFSDVVTAKNVNKYGLRPVTVLLSEESMASSASTSDYCYGVSPLYNNITTGNWYNVRFTPSDLYMTASTTRTVKIIPAIGDNSDCLIREIKHLSGSYTLTLKTSSQHITAKIGSMNVTSTGTNITLSQVLNLMSNEWSVTLTNSYTSYVQHAYIYITITNTGSNTLYMCTLPYGMA